MLRSEARTLIRANTDHDGVGDTQITDTQLNVWIDIENKLMAREIALFAPTLFTTLDDEQTLDGGEIDDCTLTIPDDFERLVRIERQAGSIWYPVPITDGLSPNVGTVLSAREEEGEFILAPGTAVTGTYRIVYVRHPLTMDSDNDALDVPQGCEDVLCERVCVRVRTKLDDDPTIHQANADRVWRTQKQALRKRYGASPVPGLKKIRNW